MRKTAPKQNPTAAGLPEGSDSEVNVVAILTKNNFSEYHFYFYAEFTSTSKGGKEKSSGDLRWESK